MCGIVGAYGFSDSSFLKRAVRKLDHRGPDSEGFMIDDHAMLGMRRLSIIDVKGGDQPIYNEDGSVCVVFNGEIYNFQELRAVLEGRGHRFRTSSDTEVIVHAYEEWGQSCASRFNGMFAFAIWDTRNGRDTKNGKGMGKGQFLACRDRYGIKPLYFYLKEGIVIVSSEMRSILGYDLVSREIDYSQVPHYLKYRYVRSPSTILKDIRKLLPGTWLKASEEGVEFSRFYSLDYAEEEHELDEAAREIDSLLSDSVRKRMISEVPIGLFLSGGIDSSSILYHMDRAKEDSTKEGTGGLPIKTFTIGFEDDGRTNEFMRAREVSEHFGTDHHEITVSMDDAIRSIPAVIRHLEEPIADATSVSSYLLSSFASKKVKVALAGEGADELFRGYVTYGNMESYTRLKAIAGPLMPLAGKAVRAVPSGQLSRLFKYPGKIGEEGKDRLAEMMEERKDDDRAYDSMISLFTDKDISLLGIDAPPSVGDPSGSLSAYARMQRYDMERWLPDYILTRVDKMSMASSLECRVPFLDFRLVDYSTRLKYMGSDKILIRKAMAGKLPKKIASRKKFPFHIPIVDWYARRLKDHYEEVFASSILIEDKVIPRELPSRLMRSHDTSPLINSRKLWSLMTLELSLRELTR